MNLQPLYCRFSAVLTGLHLSLTPLGLLLAFESHSK